MENLKSLQTSIIKMLQTLKDEASEDEFQSTMLDDLEIDALLEAIHEFVNKSNDQNVRRRLTQIENLFLDGTVSTDDLDDEIKFWKRLSV